MSSEKLRIQQGIWSFKLGKIYFNALPFDSRTSDVTLMVKGKSLGITGYKAFSARAPKVE